MKCLLITGARGFIGRHCLPLLTGVFDEVHAVTTCGEVEDGGTIMWHRFDLLSDDHSLLMQDIQPTHLLHLAWVTTPSEYWTTPENEDWERASERLGRAFIDSGGERLVMMGTCAEYDWSNGVCEEDTTPLDAQTLYGRCKTRLFKTMQNATRQADIAFAWARPFFVYGPHEPRARLIPSVICKLLNNQTAECSTGQQRRDFIYVKDAAEAIVAILTGDVHGPVNVGTGHAVSVREIVELIGEITKQTGLLHIGVRDSSSEEPLVQADTTRLVEQVGFERFHALREGLQETVDWWRKELNTA